MTPQKARFRHIVLDLSAIALLLLAVWIDWEPVTVPFILLALVLLIVSAFIMVRWWRCPHCHSALPASGILTISYCPNCGNPI